MLAVNIEANQRVFESGSPPLSQETMMEDILWYVKHYDYVSIAELRRRYEGQSEGDIAMVNDKDRNIILFTGLSQLLYDSLTHLLKERLIHIHQANILTYLADGVILQLPLAQRPPPQGYKEPHWLPVCFRVGAFCDSRECPHRPSRIKQGTRNAEHQDNKIPHPGRTQESPKGY